MYLTAGYLFCCQVRQFLAPPLRGCVLQTYGVGNAPSNREDILKALHEATERDVLIVNCTQCVHGGVVDSYAVGKVSGLDNVWSEHAARRLPQYCLYAAAAAEVNASTSVATALYRIVLLLP